MFFVSQNKKNIYIYIKNYTVNFHFLQLYKIKINLTFFKSSEHINEKEDGPYRGFDYLSLLIDPIDLTTWSL